MSTNLTVQTDFFVVLKHLFEIYSLCMIH